MNVKSIHRGWSLLFAVGMILLALLPGGARPVQAGGTTDGAPQWLEYIGDIGGAAVLGGPNAEFAGAVAESANHDVMISGAKNETIGGAAQRGAAYVYYHTSPAYQTFAQIKASDGLAYDHFGTSVAVSADGSTLLVGAYQADVSGHANQGAAYVFTFVGYDWVQQAKLTVTNGAANQFFGVSVALSEDGSTALIGANGFMYSDKAMQGGAYVFTRSGSTWTQQGSNPLMAFDAAAGDVMGGSVSLSADGNLALIGAPGKNSNRGAAYIFSRSGTSWGFQAKHLAWDGVAGDDFGRSVSLSADGSLALIGADNASVGGHAAQGAAYTFKRSGTSWTNGVKLAASNGAAGDWFGYSTSLSSDGSLAVIGALKATVPTHIAALQQGTAYAFFGANFSSQQKLIPDNSSGNARVGASVAAGDGSVLLLGAPGMVVDSAVAGIMYLFNRYTAHWVQVNEVNNLQGLKNDWMGDALSISADGKTALIGSYKMNRVSIYAFNNGAWQLQADIPSNDGATQNFGAAVALSGDGSTALVGASNTPIGLSVFQGSAYLLTRSGGAWSAPVRILAPDGLSGDKFGSAVAFSADGSTAAISASDTGARRGAVYVMTRTGGGWSTPVRYQASDGQSNQYFGNALALNGDGSTLLVGAYAASNGQTTTGAAYVFTRSGDTYTQQAKLAPVMNPKDTYFGAGVSLSSDGNTALIGAPYMGTGDVAGEIFVFTRSGTTWNKTWENPAIDGIAHDQFGQDVALSADGKYAAVGSPDATAFGNLIQGAAYIYARSGSDWVPERKVPAEDGAVSDSDGTTVALSGDGHTLLFNSSYKDDGHGVVYFFTDNFKSQVYLPMVVMR